MKTYITFHYKEIKIVKILIWAGKGPISEVISDDTSWQIGGGSHINFWTKRWLFRLVVDLISISSNIHCLLHTRVQDFWTERWLFRLVI